MCAYLTCICFVIQIHFICITTVVTVQLNQGHSKDLEADRMTGCNRMAASVVKLWIVVVVPFEWPPQCCMGGNDCVRR